MKIRKRTKLSIIALTKLVLQFTTIMSYIWTIVEFVSYLSKSVKTFNWVSLIVLVTLFSSMRIFSHIFPSKKR